MQRSYAGFTHSIALVVLASTLGLGFACSPHKTPSPITPPDQSPGPEVSLDELIKQMAEVRSAWSPEFSPDGSRVAFVSNRSGIPQVWLVAATGGEPRQVTSFDNPVSGFAWSPDEAILAVSVAPGGGMNSQIYLVSSDGKASKRITDGGKVNNWLAKWSEDGKRLYFSSNRRDPAAMDLYSYSPESETTTLIAKNPGIGRLSDASRDGKQIVVWRMENRSNTNLYLLDLGKKSEVLLTPHEGPGTFTGGTFSPDGKTIYLISNKDRELLALSRTSVEQLKTLSPLQTIAEHQDGELQSFVLSRDGNTGALLWNVAGRNQLKFLNMSSFGQRPGPTLPGDIAGGMDFSRDGKKLVLSISGATRPGDIWVYDLATRKLEQLTHSPHEGVDLAKLVKPELVRFKAHDGLSLSGWLYRPPNARRAAPFVISFHGGPEGQAQPRFGGVFQALLQHGIGVFAPNVRGSAGFGKRFVNLDNGRLRFDGIKDIKACVDYLVESGAAHPHHIGIMGGSYGGYMTMAGLTMYPELFAAGANYFGIVNFATFFKHTEPWMAAISKIEYGDPDTQAELLRDLSPIHKLDRVRAPTIVLHGANDTNVPVIEAEQVVENLRKRKIPVEYVLFPDEGHGFRKIENRIRANTATVKWFVQHLGDAESGL